jgi:hypothetical protein
VELNSNLENFRALLEAIEFEQAKEEIYNNNFNANDNKC